MDCPQSCSSSYTVGNIEQYATPQIIDECEEISSRLGSRLKIDYRPALDLILRNLVLVTPIKLKAQICEDPDDDIFIACALAAGASFIISGDKLLLKVKLPRVELITVSGFRKHFNF